MHGIAGTQRYYEDVRRTVGVEPPVVRRRRGGNRRVDRPERRREDHHFQRDHGHLSADERHRALRGAALEDCAPTRSPSAGSRDVPDDPAVCQSDRAGERHGGLHCRTHAGALAAIFRPPAQRREENQIIAEANRQLSFMGLEESRHELARNLPYGDQRRLEIARALATHPTLLILDEPAAGLNEQETLEVGRLIKQIRDSELRFLLIEHDMKVVMGVSDHIIVLDNGKKIAEGPRSRFRRTQSHRGLSGQR